MGPWKWGHASFLAKMRHGPISIVAGGSWFCHKALGFDHDVFGE